MATFRVKPKPAVRLGPLLSAGPPGPPAGGPNMMSLTGTERIIIVYARATCQLRLHCSQAHFLPPFFTKPSPNTPEPPLALAVGPIYRPYCHVWWQTISWLCHVIPFFAQIIVYNAGGMTSLPSLVLVLLGQT